MILFKVDDTEVLNEDQHSSNENLAETVLVIIFHSKSCYYHLNQIYLKGYQNRIYYQRYKDIKKCTV